MKRISEWWDMDLKAARTCGFLAACFAGPWYLYAGGFAVGLAVGGGVKLLVRLAIRLFA